MIPTNVEATVYAFTLTLIAITFGVCGSLMGIFVNKCFVGITKKNISNMYVLQIVSIVFNFYQLALVTLIPLKSDIEKYAAKKEEEY